ncbi:hypothetical protein [Chitinophaga sp. CB10]|uniref:hypothetical protein n=1 Tax=Chitinophaga sp. CB10 TaxID=1891659 RepID=UPI0025BABDF9|nr:hypothetical protein [Chitinophaga sp. CB10]
MKVMKRLLAIIIVYWLTAAQAFALPLDSLQRKEVVDRGVAALKQLIAQNEWNDRHGRSANNNYILFVDPNYITLKDGAKNEKSVWKDEFISAAESETINEELKAVNLASDNKKEFGVYVLVFNSWIINLTTPIKEGDKASAYLQLKKHAPPARIAQVNSEVKELAGEIWSKAGFSQQDFTVRIGIVYGRELLLYNQSLNRAFAITQAYGDGISRRKLDMLNANLDSVRSIGDPVGYLTTYPKALYKAFRAKTMPVQLKNRFVPALNSYFGDWYIRMPKEYKGDNDQAPVETRGVPIVDYSHGLSPEELTRVLKGLNKSSGETGYIPKVFITSYVTPDELLKQVKDYVANPAGAKEIVIWVHVAADKSIQYEYGYGKDVPQQQEISAFAALFARILPELHGNPLADMFDAISGLIGKAIVPPKYYDPEDPDFNSIPGLVVGSTVGNLVAAPLYPILSALQYGHDEDKFTMTRINFAFTVGLWNGTVEFIQGISNTLNLLSGGKEWDNMKEGITKLGELYKKEGIKGVMGVFGKMIKDAHTGNPCKVGHTIGVDVINIASFYFAFAKAGTAAKIGQLMDALDPFTYVMKGAGKVASFAFKVSGKTAKGLYQVGKKVVRIHVEDFRKLVEYWDDVAKKWIPYVLPPNGNPQLELAGVGRIEVDVSSLPGVDPQSIKAISRIEDGANAFKDDAGHIFVEIEHNGTNEVVMGKLVEQTLEDLLKKLDAYPTLQAKIKAMEEKAQRAFIEEFEGSPDVLKAFEAGAANSKGLVNPTLWKKYFDFTQVAGNAAAYSRLFSKLKGLDVQDRLRFFTHFGGDEAALKAFELGEEVSLETWKTLSVVPNSAKVFENQRFFHALLKSEHAAKVGLDHAKMSQILNARALAKRNVADFNTFKNDLGAFVENFAEVDNAKSVIANLAKEQRQGISYIGEEFVIYCLNRPEKLPFDPKEIIGFQVPVDARDIDILTSDGLITIAHEMKSIQNFEKKYITQLLKDFERAASIDEFRWLLKKKGAYEGASAMADLKATVTKFLKEADIDETIIKKYIKKQNGVNNQTKENFIKFVENNFEKIFYLID